MSYHVEYNPELRKRYPVTKKPPDQKLVKKLIFAILAVVIIYGTVRSGLAKMLLPGDPDATISAFSAMVTDVKSGDGVREAWIAFCRNIIDNAVRTS